MTDYPLKYLLANIFGTAVIGALKAYVCMLAFYSDNFTIGSPQYTYSKVFGTWTFYFVKTMTKHIHREVTDKNVKLEPDNGRIYT